MDPWFDIVFFPNAECVCFFAKIISFLLQYDFYDLAPVIEFNQCLNAAA